jgi:hypothetical protein
MSKKYKELQKKKKPKAKKPSQLLMLKMKKLSRKYLMLKLVQFNLLKKHTNSKRLRSPKEESLKSKLSLKEDHLLQPGTSNLISKKPLLNKLAHLLPKRMLLTNQDLTKNAKDLAVKEMSLPLKSK